MPEFLKRNRAKINEELNSFESRKFFTPGCYAGSVTTLPVLLTHLSGKCIDIGCGDMPYRSIIEGRINQYDSIDIEKRSPDVKYLGDVQDMNMIANDSYDSALCLEVLEHVRDPFKAVSEIHRILKKGATLVCSVPHLSRLHEEPNDFYRFTKHGLRHLFESSGFHVLSIQPNGGLFCFLGHQLSSVLLIPIWHIPILKDIVFFLNKWFVVFLCYHIDKVTDKGKIFALGYVCVVEKLQ